jgi:hypothetical protein
MCVVFPAANFHTVAGVDKPGIFRVQIALDQYKFQINNTSSSSSALTDCPNSTFR